MFMTLSGKIASNHLCLEDCLKKSREKDNSLLITVELFQGIYVTSLKLDKKRKLT
jgi:hypothetical protein